MNKKYALLSLICLLVFGLIAGYSLVWHSLASKIETELTDRFGAQALASGDFEIRRHGFPLKLAFTIEEYRHTRAQLDGKLATFKLNTPLTFSSSIASPSIIRADLSNFSLSQMISSGAEPVEEFELTIASGQMTLSPQNGTLIVKTGAWQLSADGEEPLMAAQDMRYEQILSPVAQELFDGLFSLNLQGLVINSEQRDPLALTKVAVQGGVERLPRQLVIDPTTPFHEWVHAKVRDLAAHNSRIFLNTLRLEHPDVTIQLAGETILDSDLRPEGALTLKISDIPNLTGVVAPETLNSPTFKVIQALAGTNELVLQVAVKDGVLSANQVPLMQVQPLPKMIVDAVEQLESSAQ